MSTLKRALLAAAVVALAFALPGAAQAQGSPTCAGVGGIENHAQHIIGDYVTDLGGIGGGLSWPPAGQVGTEVGSNRGPERPGGPGRHGHFHAEGLPPGASFCLPQAHPNGFNTPSPFLP